MQITTATHSPDWQSRAVRHDGAVDQTSDEPAAPVAVLLHGYGSNESDLPGLAPWLPDGMPWVSPRAPLPMPGMGYAWFPLSLPDLPAQADIDESTALLWTWIDDQIGPDRPLVLLGFSQGGLMALQLLRTRPERVAATVILAGLITGTPQAADARLAQERPPVYWGRGDADTVVPSEGVARLSSFLPSHSTLTAQVYPGLGHSVDQRVMQDVREFLAENLP